MGMRNPSVQCMLCSILALRFLLPNLTMPPKVKSVEAMATQLSVPVEEPVEETQQVTQPGQDDHLTPNEVLSQPENPTAALLETPPKRGRSIANGSSAKRGRPTMVSLVAMKISDDLELHPFVIQRVLDSLEKMAVKSLVERGVFHTNIFTAKLRTRKARQAGEQQRVYGKDIVVKGKPERRTLKLQPTKMLKQKCM